MVFTKATTPSARLGDGLSPGAAASRSWAASGVSSGLVGGVKGPCPISKLPEIEARTVPKIDYENDYEQMCERELERQERIALITGRPWHEAREGAVLPWHWTEDLGRDNSVWRFETVTRVERVQQRREPPPLRDDPAYGPRASNPQGDASFRADRMAWFERVTGDSLEGVDLSQQWQRADRVARAFRADTRVSRRRWDFYCDDV